MKPESYSKPQKKREFNVLAVFGGSYIGGAEIIMMDQIEGLSACGISVRAIISGWNDGKAKHRLTSLGVSVKEIKLGWIYLRKPRWTFDSLINLPRAVVDCRCEFLSKRPDVIFTSSYRSIIGAYFFIRSPVIFNVQDCPGADRQFRFFLPIIDRKVTRYAACSSFIADDLRKCGVDPAKIEVVHNGTKIAPVPEPVDHLEKSPDEGENVLTFGISGQIIPNKGHEDVVTAVEMLRDIASPRFHLYIVGNFDTPFARKLKRRVEEAGLHELVFFRGFMEGEAIYDNVDVLIVPTRTQEPFGLVSIEAQARGIPVIATATGGLKETVVDGITGRIVPQSNPNALAEVLLDCLENREKWKAMGQEGRKMVSAGFTIESNLQKIRDLLISATNDHGHRLTAVS